MASASQRAGAALLAALSASIGLPRVAAADEIPGIVVSPYFIPTSIARAGSTVSVITREEIERSSAGSVAELLRSVPGLGVTESGGPGSTSQVGIRGAEVQHTLVLIDGIRVNDPSSARDSFDFASLSLDDVERIEVLKGPQSALYGSDAMGGVINIITRKHSGGLKYSATAEGGSYGTRDGRISASGSSGPLSISGTGTWFHTDGFSRVGNRDTGERDPTDKWSGQLRATIDPGSNWKLDLGLDSQNLDAAFDKSSTTDASGYWIESHILNAYGRFTLDMPNYGLTNTFTVFRTNTTRRYNENGPITDYRGTDTGAEYQGLYKLPVGSLIFGTRFEQEDAWQRMPPAPPSFSTSRDLYAGYLLYQLPVGERLNLSFAGRYDGAIDETGFATGRATAVYELPDWGARIRGSLGTGAKRPTAYQLSWNPALTSEKSIGADLGFEQTLPGGRVSYSVTGFYNHFDNLIDFTGAFPGGNYRNVTRAETAGVEIAGSVEIVPAVLTGTVAYTYLYSHDLSAPDGVPLARRPQHSGKVSLTYTGIENLSATVSATVVGDRFNDNAGLVPLPAYAVIDLSAKYKVNEHVSVFGRVDNLFNASYQEVQGYNTPGLSAYVGLTVAN